jgi:hypothetical protein
LFSLEKLADQLRSLLTIGGEAPMQGVYLHILWLKSKPDIVYLYVGQSIQMPKRLENHQTPTTGQKFQAFITSYGIVASKTKGFKSMRNLSF